MQVSDVTCRRRESSLPFLFHAISDVLLDGLTQYDEFIYVVIATPPDLLIP